MPIENSYFVYYVEQLHCYLISLKLKGLVQTRLKETNLCNTKVWFLKKINLVSNLHNCIIHENIDHEISSCSMVNK